MASFVLGVIALHNINHSDVQWTGDMRLNSFRIQIILNCSLLTLRDIWKFISDLWRLAWSISIYFLFCLTDRIGCLFELPSCFTVFHFYLWILKLKLIPNVCIAAFYGHEILFFSLFLGFFNVSLVCRDV